MEKNGSEVAVDFTQPGEVAGIVQRAFDEITKLQGEVSALTELMHLMTHLQDVPESAKVSSALCLRFAAQHLLANRPESAVLAELAAGPSSPPPRVSLKLVVTEGAPRG